MKHCQQCGAELAPDSKFCIQCGSRVENGIEETPEQVAAPVAPAPPPPAYAYPPPPVQAPQPPPGGPYPPQAYAYAPPPGYGAPVKKKKRWWIPVVIVAVILALLAGSWFVFGDQIRSLFMSTEQKWQKAEKTFGLVPEGTLIHDIRTSSEKLSRQTKFGATTDLTLDLQIDEMPDELAEILTIVSSLRFHLENKVDLDEDDPHFYMQVGLGKRADSDEALSLLLYDAEDHLVIEVPDILPRPLAIPRDFLEEVMEDTGEFDIPLDSLLTSSNSVRKAISSFSSDKLDTIADELKAIFSKYADKPELVKGEVLTIGGVSQKLDYYDVTVPADKFAPMAREILNYLKENNDIRKLLEELQDVSMVTMPYPYGSAVSLHDSFVDAINDMLEGLDIYPEDYRIAVQRKLYVDKKNHPVGGEFILINRIDGRVEKVRIASLHVEDGGQHAQLFAFETPEDIGFEYLSEYRLKDKHYTGDYAIRLRDWSRFYDDEYHEMGRGSFTDFALQAVDDGLYPVGEITYTIRDLQDLTYDYDAPESVTVKYNGAVEKGQLVATIELAMDVEEMPIKLKLGITHAPLAQSSLTFKHELPMNFIDLSHEESMMELLSDEDMMNNLMSALEKLGIDPEILNGPDDFDDVYDWDDFDWDD
jgi:hypothetical protein